jgi:hypothetical protein
MVTTTKYILGILTIIILATAITIQFGNDAKIKISGTKSDFYLYENGWILSGTEYNALYNGTSLIAKDTKPYTLTNTLLGNNQTYFQRTVYYQNNVSLIDTYSFDGNVKAIELFPISHQIQIINGKGLTYQYQVKGINYNGSSMDVSSPYRYGRMKINWQDGYYYSKISSASKGTLTVKYKINEAIQNYDVRLFDPITYINQCQALATAGETYTLNASILNDTIITDCLRVTNQNITVDYAGFSISSIKNLTGVYTNQKNTTVKNCNVTMGGTGTANIQAIGIEYVAGATDGLIFNNTANSNIGYGIFINSPDRLNVTGNTGTSIAGVGIRSIGSENSSFNSNTGTSVTNYGLGIESSGLNNVEFNLGIGNKTYGLNLESLSDSVIFYNNGTSNSSYGIYLIDSTNVTFNHNLGISLGGRGIYVVRGINSTYFSNIGIGTIGMIFNTNSFGNITNNTGTSVANGDGLNYDTVIHSFISSNIGTSTLSNGIESMDCLNNTYISNVGISNNTYGFYIRSTTNSTFNYSIGTSNSSYGTYVYTSNNNLITNIKSISLGSVANNYGMTFRQSNNNVVQDCLNITGTKGDILYIVVAPTNNTFINCSYRTSNETVVAGASLIRKWYYRANVTETGTSIPVNNANITAWNSSGTEQFSLLTTNGLTPITTIIDYINLGGVRNYYSNYQINATIPGDTASHLYNVTNELNNLNDTFQLGTLIFLQSPANNTSYNLLNNTFQCNASGITLTNLGIYVFENGGLIHNASIVVTGISNSTLFSFDIYSGNHTWFCSANDKNASSYNLYNPENVFIGYTNASALFIFRNNKINESLPDGQTNETGFYNVTNFNVRNVSIYSSVNYTVPQVTLKANGNSNYTTSIVIDTTNKTIFNLTGGSYNYIWFWADYVNYSGAGFRYNPKLSINYL